MDWKASSLLLLSVNEYIEYGSSTHICPESQLFSYKVQGSDVTLSLPTCPVSAWTMEPKQHTELKLAESQAQSPRAADLMECKPEGSSEQFTASYTHACRQKF